MDRDAYVQMAAHQDEHWWFCGRRRVLRAVLASLGLPAQARILEVGCGPGGNLKMLGEFGTVDAVEGDDLARDQARSLSGVDVQFGLLPAPLPFEGRRYDLIALFDVLEHVDDDRGALAALAARLAPGGALLLTVPAYGWLFSAHDRRHHHRRRYTASSLTRVARTAGWRVERSGYFNTLLFPLAAAKRLTERLTHCDGGDDSALPPNGLNVALKRVFSIECLWSGRWFAPVGLSAIAILRIGPSSGRHEPAVINS